MKKFNLNVGPDISILIAKSEGFVSERWLLFHLISLSPLHLTSHLWAQLPGCVGVGGKHNAAEVEVPAQDAPIGQLWSEQKNGSQTGRRGGDGTLNSEIDRSSVLRAEQKSPSQNKTPIWLPCKSADKVFTAG